MLLIQKTCIVDTSKVHQFDKVTFLTKKKNQIAIKNNITERLIRSVVEIAKGPMIVFGPRLGLKNEKEQ